MTELLIFIAAGFIGVGLNRAVAYAKAERRAFQDLARGTGGAGSGSASAIIDAAPRPELARPARSRIPAMTGAPVSVLIVVTSGDRPRRSTCLPANFVCPNDAPCLL
jgi:hypothetical protein